MFVSMLRARPAPTSWHPAWWLLALSVLPAAHANLFPLYDYSIEDPFPSLALLRLLITSLVVQLLVNVGSLRSRLDGVLVLAVVMPQELLVGVACAGFGAFLPFEGAAVLQCVVQSGEKCLDPAPDLSYPDYRPGLQLAVDGVHRLSGIVIVLGSLFWIGLRQLWWALQSAVMKDRPWFAGSRTGTALLVGLVLLQVFLWRHLVQAGNMDTAANARGVAGWIVLTLALVALSRRVASALTSPSTSLHRLAAAFLVTGALAAVFSGFIVFPRNVTGGIFTALGFAQIPVRPGEELFMGLSLYALMTLGALTVSRQRPLPLLCRVGAYAAWVLGAFAFFALDSEESLRSWSWEAREQVRDLAVPAVRMVAASFFGLGLLFTVPRTKGRAGSE